MTAANWSIEDTYGSHEIKLPAGDLVLYPASSLHLVTPVTRGVRVASFFWLQSMIRDAHARSLIYDLDTCDPGAGGAARAGRPRNGQADRHLSQPDPPLGGDVGIALMRAKFWKRINLERFWFNSRQSALKLASAPSKAILLTMKACCAPRVLPQLARFKTFCLIVPGRGLEWLG